MIDECQQIIGHMFNPNETGVMIGLCDWLGLSPEFVITLSAYYTQKKPGCNVSYIQRAAVDLVNLGVDSFEALDAHLKDMELYDGLSGKLRSWLGIGARAYTKKENATINHWIKDLNYGEDIVHYAYEITVDSSDKGLFKFDYANKILENWFSEGVRTVDEAKEKVSKFRQENKSKSKSKGSFDTEELFDLALKRGYGKMLGETKKS
jgi:DnaD/phage-associated family protein